MRLPAISPLSANPLPNAVVDVPPPLRFRPLEGLPQKVSLGPMRAQTQIHPSMSKAKINGIRYEWQVYSWLGGLFKPICIQHFIHFTDDVGRRSVIPDAFVVTPACVVLFEVKSQHMPDTWWQCEKLYKPLLQELFQKEVFCVEIVRRFDPQMTFPVRFDIIEDLPQWVDEPRSNWGVFKWQKK